MKKNDGIIWIIENNVIDRVESQKYRLGQGKILLENGTHLL